MLNAVRAAAAPKPPFRMEIVEAQGVREVLFDAETGRPIRPTNEAAGPTLQLSTSRASRSDACSGPRRAGRRDRSRTAAAADKMLEDFPIDFNQPH